MVPKRFLSDLDFLPTEPYDNRSRLLLKGNQLLKLNDVGQIY